MTDPRDIAEVAICAIDPEILLRIIEQYERYPKSESTLHYFRSSLAIAARRAIDTKHPERIEQ